MTGLCPVDDPELFTTEPNSPLNVSGGAAGSVSFEVHKNQDKSVNSGWLGGRGAVASGPLWNLL